HPDRRGPHRRGPRHPRGGPGGARVDLRAPPTFMTGKTTACEDLKEGSPDRVIYPLTRRVRQLPDSAQRLGGTHFAAARWQASRTCGSLTGASYNQGALACRGGPLAPAATAGWSEATRINV